MTIRISDTLLARVQIVASVLVAGLVIVAAYQNYQGDKCSEAFATLAASNQARINNVQKRLEAVRTREAALQERTRAQSAPARDPK